MKFKKLILYILSMLIMTNCSVNSVSKLETTSSSVEFEDHISSQPTSIHTPSMTKEFLEFSIQTYCPTEEIGLDKIVNLNGTLVFAADSRLYNENLLTPDSQTDSQISFWDSSLDQFKYYELSENFVYYYYLESPDKHELALTIGKTMDFASDLIIVDQNGIEVQQIEFPETWTFFDWLNNNQLLFRQYRILKDLERSDFDLISINLFDKKQQILSSEFSDIYYQEMFWDWGSITLYNPDLSYLVYPIRKENPSQLITVMWDINNNKEVARIPASDWARWSPSGDEILLVSDVNDELFQTSNEIMIVESKDGSISQTTKFSEYFDNLIMNFPVWSPDGNQIAFWISTSTPIETAKLAVLDITTNTVDIYCKEIIPFPFRFGGDPLGYSEIPVNSTSPIWSPDGKYILLEDRQSSGDMAYIVDLERNRIAKIGEDVRPIAWLN